MAPPVRPEVPDSCSVCCDKIRYACLYPCNQWVSINEQSMSSSSKSSLQCSMLFEMCDEITTCRQWQTLYKILNSRLYIHRVSFFLFSRGTGVIVDCINEFFLISLILLPYSFTASSLWSHHRKANQNISIRELLWVNCPLSYSSDGKWISFQWL